MTVDFWARRITFSSCYDFILFESSKRGMFNLPPMGKRKVNALEKGSRLSPPFQRRLPLPSVVRDGSSLHASLDGLCSSFSFSRRSSSTTLPCFFLVFVFDSFSSSTSSSDTSFFESLLLLPQLLSLPSRSIKLPCPSIQQLQKKKKLFFWWKRRGRNEVRSA